MNSSTRHFYFASVASALVLASLSSTAFAAQKKLYQPEDPNSVTVDLNRSDLTIAPQEQDVMRSSSIGAGISTWSPNHFSLPSNISSTGAFSRIGSPGVYVTYFTPVLNRDVNFKAGLNWIGLTRTGSLADSSVVSTTTSQDVNVFSVRVGLEYDPHAIASRVFTPYVSGALLPSFAITTQTAFDDGNNYFGIPVELAVGSRVSLNGFGLKGWDLDVNGNAVAGTINGSSVAGFGIEAGVRVIL
jgi:hypothetical protein